MSEIKKYEYSCLKSEYFSQFEKMWIEGFCKESKIELSETNVCAVLSTLLSNKNCPAPIKQKTSNLMVESEKFSNYSKDMFIKTWNNILGFTMNVVKPEGTLHENQLESMKTTNIWWLTQAPKIMASEMQFAYFKSLVVECVSENANALADLKNYSPIKQSRITENAKKYFSYEKITMPYPPNTQINLKEILINEAVLCMVPNPDKLVSIIVWTSITTLLTK